MKVAFILKKSPVAFILLFCFVTSFTLVEAGRSIRLRKVKTHVAPRHISLSARSGNGIYARTFAYGRPIPNYSTTSKINSNRRYSQRRRYGKRERLPRTYANKYRNWSPNARKSPRADQIGQLKRRKELLPFLSEPPYGPNKYKRRVRPQRPNPMQRPKPPKKPNREEFDDEYFFPEEAKRGETKYEFENPRPKKKRRPDFESYYKPPSLGSKIPYYDEKPLGYKTKPREPPFSYSSFVQHSSGSSDDPDDLYEDSDSIYSQPVVRNKKKRVKKKSNSRKKNKEQYKPFVFENDSSSDYPPYVNPEDYDLPAKTYKKRNKPSYDSDDEFLPSKTYPQPQLQASNLFSTESDYNRKKTQPVQFNPSYSQTWTSVVETTARPLQYQTENGFQPQQYVPAHYNYNNDYSTLQKTKTVTTNTRQTSYYSQPDNSYKSVAFNNNNYASQVSTTQSQSPTNYNANYNANYNQTLPASSSVLTDVTIQKSVPIYDNTETFYNFNNNAYVNSQSSKYYNSDSGYADNSQKYYNSDSGYADNSQKYGTRFSASSGTKLGEKTDSDSEFLKKHQNLYNNGLSGVPVQGDGFAKEGGKKDYDIGYGDFQFDENPNT